jgi:hypothetical protein
MPTLPAKVPNATRFCTPTLKASVVTITLAQIPPTVVTCASIWESAPGGCARDEGGPLVAGLQDLAAKRLALRW